MTRRTLGASVLVAWSLVGCTHKTVIGVLDGGHVPCATTADCDPSRYCSNAHCMPKLLAGACSTPEICQSGTCLMGACCATTCPMSDSACGAVACDVGSGICLYPNDGTTCGAPETCTGGVFHPPSTCDGAGGCAVSPPQQCGAYLCNTMDGFCYNACTYEGQCAAEAYCAGRFCQFKEAAGQSCVATSTSDANSACLSGICSGNCCVKDCPADPTTNNCKGTCDDTGACTPLSCPNNFGCGGTQVCKNRCATPADCNAPAFCDLTGGTGCCPRYMSGDILYVDGTTGDDTQACCGTGAVPCQTITHAMELVATSKSSGVFLNVANSQLLSNSSWTAKETYPIHLGWGVTLNAPSLFFANRVQASDIFQVYSYGPGDTGVVTIQGGSVGIGQDGVYIGWDILLTDTEAGLRHTTIAVNAGVPGETAVPLVLSEVWLNANDTTGHSIGLNVGPGATVTLGPRRVEIGAGFLLDASTALTTDRGITCAGAGATIRDDPAANQTVLTMDGITTSYLDVEDGCSADLNRGPTFGYHQATPRNWDGTDVGCCGSVGCSSAYCTRACQPPQPSVAGVRVAGSGRVTFGSVNLPGSITCAGPYAFDEEAPSANGSPSLALRGAIVDLLDYGYYDHGVRGGGGSACAGAMVTAGTFSAAATTFKHSYLGVFVGDQAAKADLSGDGGGGNTFGCNGASWGASTACGTHVGEIPLANGAAVINATSGVGINARHATWDLWDAVDNSTQVWKCPDKTYANCTCAGPGCASLVSPGTPPDGADAIYLSTNLATTPLDTASGSQASAASCP